MGAILSALFPSLGKRLSNRKSKSQSRLAAVEDSLAPPPLPLPSGGWTFSLLPNSLQEDKDDEGEDERSSRDDTAAVVGTPTESLGKRILFRPDQMKNKKKNKKNLFSFQEIICASLSILYVHTLINLFSSFHTEFDRRNESSFYFLISSFGKRIVFKSAKSPKIKYTDKYK